MLPTSHPLAVTSTGYDLIPELLALLKNSDATLVVGSKLAAERTAEGRLPLPSPLVHIDIDATEIGRQYRATAGVVGDACLALDALLENLDDLPQPRPTRTDEVAAAVAALCDFTRRSTGEVVALLDALRAALPPESVVVADMMMLGYASARYFPVYEPRSYIHPVEFCAIGCGLPLALGAKATAPQRPIVALCGDGGFLLNASELATAVQEQLDLVVIVFKDHAFTAVKKVQHQRFAGHYIATDLVGPDFTLLARAFGVRGVQAQDAATLHDAVSEALQEGGTTLIEVALPPWQWYAQ